MAFGTDAKMSETRLEQRLAEQPGLDEDAVETVLSSLSDLGYLWKPPGQKQMEPGLPSLMRYVLHYDDETLE